MTETEFKNILTNDIKKVEHTLLSFLPDCKDGQESVVQAMEYSLVNGGKRLRPVFTLEFAQACGGSREDALPFACAMEYVHTYSLMAGDALLTHAFEIIASSDLSDDKKVSASLLLAQNAGVGGMIGGQVIDLIYEKENPTVKQLLNVYRMKTGALISAACLMGCISAGADEKKMSAASKFAYSLGIAFQIQDDILDIVGDEKELGKPVGSDAENEKITYATLVGIEKAKSDVKKLTNAAVNQLDIFENSDFLKALALSLVNRKK